MTLAALAWLFTGGALLHNLEESLWLPRWSAHATYWYRPVPAPVFRLAAGALSLIFVVVTLAATLSPPRGMAVYLMAGYALAMALNALFPHLLVTLVQRRIMPGTVTGVLLNLPLGLLYLHRAFAEQTIEWQVFRWAGPLVVVGLLALIPLLFALARGVRRLRP